MCCNSSGFGYKFQPFPRILNSGEGLGPGLQPRCGGYCKQTKQTNPPVALFWVSSCTAEPLLAVGL